MKVCKSCIKEIEDKASKCPYCQSFQYWYKNPQYISFVFIPLIFLPAIMFPSMMGGKQFSNFSSQIQVEFVSSYNSNYTQSRTYKLTNKTKYKWTSPNYILTAKKADNSTAYTKCGIEPGVILQPNASTMMTISYVDSSPDIKDWEIQLVDMRNDRF